MEVGPAHGQVRRYELVNLCAASEEGRRELEWEEEWSGKQVSRWRALFVVAFFSAAIAAPAMPNSGLLFYGILFGGGFVNDWNGRRQKRKHKRSLAASNGAQQPALPR